MAKYCCTLFFLKETILKETQAEKSPKMGNILRKCLGSPTHLSKKKKDLQPKEDFRRTF